MLAVSVTISPIKDAAGRVIGSSAIARDISERKQTEAEREQLLEQTKVTREEAEKTNHLKYEFLATISHELRTSKRQTIIAIQGVYSRLIC